MCVNYVYIKYIGTVSIQETEERRGGERERKRERERERERDREIER